MPVNVFGCLPHRHKYAKYVTPRQHHNTKVSEVSRVIQHIKIQINSIISILRPNPSTSNTLRLVYQFISHRVRTLKKLTNQPAGKKTKKHTLFTYALGKIKLFRVKESVYVQKLVKYSTRSESHPRTHTRHPARTIPRYVLHMRR